jgi:hypothetical protein
VQSTSASIEGSLLENIAGGQSRLVAIPCPKNSVKNYMSAKVPDAYLSRFE